MKAIVDTLQPLGRALMLPIAVLPAAGLLLRLGQPDLLNLGFVSAAGDAIFSNLGLLFAVGVATAFARDGNGAAGLAGLVCFLVSAKGGAAMLTLPPDVAPPGLPDATAQTLISAWRSAQVARFDVPIGIVSGLIGGTFYNRFSGVKLPDYLAFFGGRRLVPIVAGGAGVVIAGLLGVSMGSLARATDALGKGVSEAGPIGLFAFGVLNRLLLVTGLHHILNNIPYFVVGNFHGATGDLRRFFAGDPTAGGFMSGFFPVMMFGLPAAALAMYHTARPDRKAAVGGMLFSLALTSFLTGVTEPIEFSFMFLAPLLYGVHALLTGLAEVVMALLGVKLGYGFSAGFFDYVLNFGKATRPLLLLPVGAAYALVYYGLFRWVIVRFDLPTPGRERDAPAAAASHAGSGGRTLDYIRALGGSANLEAVDACTTRLRLKVRDSAALDGGALKALGAAGVIRPSPTSAQVVVGPAADGLAMDIRAALEAEPAGAGPRPGLAAQPLQLSAAMAAAFGGPANVRSAERASGRLRIELVDRMHVEGSVLAALGVLAWREVAPGVLHVLAPAGVE